MRQAVPDERLVRLPLMRAERESGRTPASHLRPPAIDHPGDPALHPGPPGAGEADAAGADRGLVRPDAARQGRCAAGRARPHGAGRRAGADLRRAGRAARRSARHHRRRHRPVGHPRARTPGCATRTNACAAGSRSRWRSTRRTSGSRPTCTGSPIRRRPTSPPAWWPMPAGSMPRRCCCRSGRTTASARARSRSTNAAWSAASPRSARAPRGCC